MHRTLVVCRTAEDYAATLQDLALPGLVVSAHPSSESARAVCSSAEILFGAPDLLAELLPDCPRVRWVQSTWAGLRPLVEQPRRDFTLTGVKGIFGPTMSEYVLGWLLAIERRILERGTTAKWLDDRDRTLQGKTLGIMGTGSIGTHVAQSCRQLGLRVLGLNRNGRDGQAFDQCFAIADWRGFVSGLDYLVCLLPETPDTDNLVDRDFLALMPPGGVLINAGRGNCIVDDDVLAALQSGQLRAAVLDVFREEPLPEAHPFWSAPNLHVTSHTAAPTPEDAVVQIFADNYLRYREGKALTNRIDFEQGY